MISTLSLGGHHQIINSTASNNENNEVVVVIILLLIPTLTLRREASRVKLPKEEGTLLFSCSLS